MARQGFAAAKTGRSALMCRRSCTAGTERQRWYAALKSPDFSPPEFQIVPQFETGIFVIASRITVRSEEHTSELQSLMRISYAVFCLKKKNTQYNKRHK